MAQLAIIVAHAQNGTIGLAGNMPCRLSEDLKHFKEVTMGHPVVMGRVTHESIGRPLPGRDNIVISRNPDYRPEGCRTATSLEEAAGMIKNDELAFVIGGAQIYAQALKLVDTCWITEIQAEYPGDAFFGPLSLEEWDREVLSELPANEKRPALTFCIFRRKH